MSTSKNIDKICCIGIVFVLLLTGLSVYAQKFGIRAAKTEAGYEKRLFDTERVHTIDLVMDDWEGFLESCEDEEYEICSAVIDQEAYKNIGIRAKGNTSLRLVSSYDSDRYSFKIEFDHYDNTQSYYGLDKLSLNNIIQDNTYMKDYLSYQMMGSFGVSAPLCSYVYLTVNGEDWGLYLAVEGVEESFLERNYGSDYGNLYKPDSMDMGGGRGNGGAFDPEQFQQKQEKSEDETVAEDGMKQPEGGLPEGGMERPQGDMPEGRMERPQGDMPEGRKQRPQGEQPEGGMERSQGDMPEGRMERPQGEQLEGGRGNGMKGEGKSDVLLVYSDDDPESYANIFENAKTDLSDADKDRLIASIKALNEQEDIENVVDAEAVIRYFVVHNFVCNFDSYTGSMIHNYYLYEKDGKMSMIPWDYNLAFGGFQSQSDAEGLINYPIDTPVSGQDVDARPMLAWIFQNEQYTDLYHQYFSEFITSYFDSGYFSEMMDSVSQMIAPYVEKDPTKFCTYEEFQTGVSALKEFCLLRAESVNGQLDGTIPADADGQAQNSDALISGDSVTISDMGNMDRGMTGGRTGRQNENAADQKQ